MTPERESLLVELLLEAGDWDDGGMTHGMTKEQLEWMCRGLSASWSRIYRQKDALRKQLMATFE